MNELTIYGKFTLPYLVKLPLFFTVSLPVEIMSFFKTDIHVCDVFTSEMIFSNGG